MTDETDFTQRRASDIPGLEDDVDQADRDVRLGVSEGDDLPVTLPEEMPRGSERVMAGLPDGESIDERLAQEEPDPGTAYGDPDEVLKPSLGATDGDDVSEDELLLDGETYGDDALETSGAGAPEEVAMHLAGRDEPLP